MSQNLYDYGGVGAKSSSNILPNRVLDKKDKVNKAPFKREVLDGLERIGTQQLKENQSYVDYFKMVYGELVYTDITEDSDTLKELKNIRDEVGIDTWLKHYDIIGDITNTLVGEWLLYDDEFRIDTVDEVSTNEYIREQTQMLEMFAEAKIQEELMQKTVELGLLPPTDDSNEEEIQQYQQQLEQFAEQYFPENIKEKMKSWKTSAAIWGQKTYDRDYTRFKMDLLRSKEATNKILVGVAPRHYLIGYDFYKPESWSPINTFYSKDLDIDFIQDGEFAGRIHYYSVNELIDRYGHRLTADQIKRMSSMYSYSVLSNGPAKKKGIEAAMKDNFVEPTLFPFKGADDYAVDLQFQEALGQPLGVVGQAEDGKDIRRQLPEYFDWGNSNKTYAYNLAFGGRQVRSDLIKTTEGYVKMYKKIGVLTYRTSTGYLDVREVDDELLEDFLKENGIKKVTSTSFQDAIRNPKENTVVYTYIPEVYEAIKINVDSEKDGGIYFLEPMEFQIRDNSKYYKPLIPVFGHISQGIGPLLRGYQSDINWVMNQNKNLMEKELGMFFMMDINFLPTEFMDLSDDSQEALVQMYNTIKDIGILPIDASKGNLSERGGVMFNSLMAQNVTFTPQIQRNVELFMMFKREAYSRIGLTPQRESTPTSYETATGVKMKQNAGYSKTTNLFQELLTDEQCKIEGHLAVAQYCQIHNRDYGYIYRASDLEITFLQSIKDDKYFSSRAFGVYSTMSPAKKRDFEMLKATILERNTMTADELGLAELIYSRSYLELKEAAQKLRAYQEQMAQQRAQEEQQNTDKLIQSQEKVEADKLTLEYAKLDNKVDVEKIRVLRSIPFNKNVDDPTQEITEATEEIDKARNEEVKNDIDYQKLQQNFQNSLSGFNIKLKELELREKQLNQREKERQSKDFRSIINKN